MLPFYGKIRPAIEIVLNVYVTTGN